MDVITFPVNRLTTSGLQILLHGDISLPDATSYDKCIVRGDRDSRANLMPIYGDLYQIKL